MKHGIPKGDKKKKKEVTAEIALLEEELTTKHERELSDLHNTCIENKEVKAEDASNSQDNGDSSLDNELMDTSQKISKAQKRRNRKANKAKEREDAIAQQEIDNLTGIRNVECEKLKKILSERGLAIHEVPSDGDCLYKAVEHQLSTLNLQKTTVKKLRQLASDYMLSHVDDFIPFLTDPKSGDLMSKDQYDNYCKEIANAPTWGGQVEVQALSHVCGTPIEVVQAEGPSVLTGENNASSKVILSYHRHMYGLGEHYNSVIQKEDTDEDI